MDAAEIRLDLVAGHVDGRGDDVARMLAAQLDDVFAEIGLDRHDAVLFQEGVEADLLGDHRLALGDGLGVPLAGDVEEDLAGVVRILGEMHDAAGGFDLGHIGLDIEVEMLQRVVLDGDGVVAQGVEFRQGVDGGLALVDEALLDMAEGPLQLDIGERLDGIGLERMRSDLHGAEPIRA